MNITNENVCGICLSPVNDPICIKCLYEDAKRWILGRNVRVMKKFSVMTGIFKKIFSSDYIRGFCVRCKSETLYAVCPKCYLSETFSWLNKQNRKIASEFKKIFFW